MTFRNSCIWALCLLVLVLASVAFPQVDIAVPGRGSYRDLGRGLAWGSAGIGGVNNAWIVTPSTPDTGYCVFVTNRNPTNLHNFTLRAYETGDQRQSAYLAASGRWLEVPISSTLASVAAATTVSTYVRTSAAARVAFSFSGSTVAAGSPDTADIFVVESQTGACGDFTVDRSTGPILCDKTVWFSSPGTAGQRLIQGADGKTIYICSLYVSSVDAPTTAGAIYLQTGTGIVCNTGTTNVIGNVYAANMPTAITWGGGSGWVIKSGGVNDICASAVTHGVTGVVNYTIF